MHKAPRNPLPRRQITPDQKAYYVHCKTRAQCGESKPLAAFTRIHDKRCKRPSHKSECKVCCSTRAKTWQAANKERREAQMQTYMALNRERVLERRRERARGEGGAKKRAGVRAWQQANPHRMAALCAKRHVRPH